SMSSRRATNPRTAPFFPKASAIPSPMPLDAPVRKTVLLFQFILCVSLPSSRLCVRNNCFTQSSQKTQRKRRDLTPKPNAVLAYQIVYLQADGIAAGSFYDIDDVDHVRIPRIFACFDPNCLFDLQRVLAERSVGFSLLEYVH